MIKLLRERRETAAGSGICADAGRKLGVSVWLTPPSLFEPRAGAQGLQPVWRHAAPRITGGVEDGLVAVVQAMGEMTLAQVEPDSFDRWSSGA
jgi:hypothetical protein